MALYGGAEVVVVRLAKYLQEHGHVVDIATLSTAKHKDYNGLNFILPTESAQMQYRLRDGSVQTLLNIGQMFSRLRKLCAEHADSYDVINAHNFPAIWSVPRGARTVWMCNEIPDPWHSAPTSSLSNQLWNIGRFGDRLIVKTKQHVKAVVADVKVAGAFRQRYGFEPNIIPYGIDGEFLSQGERRLNDTFHIICPSMVSPSKNQLGILEAIYHALPKARVTLSGYCEDAHPYAQQIRRYIKETSLRVDFVGPIDRESLRSLYHTAHVAVFSGKGQGSWLGPFEQLSVGTPIIVSPNLTCSSLVKSKNLGIVSNDIAGSLILVNRMYHEFQQQALLGQRFVLQELTWDKFCSRFEEVLHLL